MNRRRFTILGLCHALLTAGSSVARENKPGPAAEAPVAFRLMYRKDHKQKEWTAGTERFRSAQAAETAAQRLMDARAVVAARVEAFDPATGKTVPNPRPKDARSGPAKPVTPPAPAGRQRNSYPPGERPVSTEGDPAASSRSSRERRPFINLGGVSVTNDFIGRRRPQPPRNKGWLAAKGESGAEGSSAISRGTGDLGGRSYGTFQLSSAPGAGGSDSSVERFVDRYYPKDFADKDVNTLPFMERWLRLSLEEPDSFRNNEEEFIRQQNVDPMERRLEKTLGLDLDNRSDALREALWSVAVQHGPNLGAELVQRTVKDKNVDEMKDRELIGAIYNERLQKDEDGTLVYFGSDQTSNRTRTRSNFG